MKRFIKKAKRKVRHLNLNPKVIGILSVFVIAITFGVFTLSSVFAEDISFEMIPDKSTPYERSTGTSGTANKYATITVQFDCADDLVWDNVAVNVDYDPNVFTFNRASDVLTTLDGDDPDNFGDNINLQKTGETGRYTLFLSNMDSTLETHGGVIIATLKLRIKETAPGGATTISFRTNQTYASNGGTHYSATYTDAQVVISVPVDPDTIEISPDSLDLDINTAPSATLTPVYEPEGANYPDKNLNFISLDTSVANVDSLSGVVTAVAPGDTTIRVSLFGTTVDVPVHVKAGLISIALDEQSVQLNKGGTKDYTVTKNPTSPTDNVEIVWSSSNTNVATVDSSGHVVAVGGGQSTITATAKVNGQLTDIKATSLVNVNVPLNSVSGTPAQINLQRGVTGHNDQTITVTYDPTDTTVDKTVSYSIEPSSGVATISNTGVVTAVGKGDAVVTGTVAGKSFHVNVHVDVPIQSFSISPTSGDLYVDQNRQLTPSFTPPAAEASENTNIRWVSSNQNVATVDENGYVTAVAAGQATITAYTGSGGEGNERLSSSTTFNVYDEIEGATMSESEFTLYTNGNDSTAKRKTKNLSVTINPTGSGIPSDRNVSWSASPSGVVTVDQNGKVTAVGNGTATIIANVSGKAEATATVTVETSVESFAITNSTDVTLEKGDSHTITYSILPTTATHQTVTWTSSNEDRATVSPGGIITACGNGDVVITGQVDGKEVTIPVHVITTTTNVVISTDNGTSVEKNGFLTIYATVTPSDTTDSFSWSSLTEDKATIINDGIDTATGRIKGKITGQAAGQATIKAKSGPIEKTINIDVIVHATGINITDNDFTLNQGNYKTLNKTVTPSDSTDTITWASDNTSVATVDQNGKVTAVSTGEANISATVNGHSDSVKVTVLLPAEAIHITGANPLVVQKGDNTTTLSATVTPSGATGTINWTSSNTSVLTIDEDGKINAKATGTTTVTASVGTVSDSITINVIKSATGIDITEGTSTTVNKNATKTLHATLTPSDSTDNIVWSSSDSTTVSVNQSTGVVTGLKAGSATITATVQPVNAVQSATQGSNNATNVGLSGAGEIKDTITVNVLVPTTSISITDGETINMIKGQEKTLGVNVQPADHTDGVTWESSDTNKATVDSNGKVTAVGTGTVTITVNSGNKSDSITIGISYPATSVQINGADTRTIHRGNNETLTATVQPSGSTDGLTWVSNKPSVASVNATTGQVTANAIGTAVITARAGDKTDTVTINVDAPITAFTSEETNISIVKGNTKTLTYTITPSDTTDSKTVTWESNDTNKVTVDQNGKITAKAQGSTTVVARLGTRSITYNVTVTIIPVTGITLNKDTLSVRKGETDSSLTYTITPADTTEDKTVTWESSDPTVATVDQNGKVTGKKAGNTTVTVRNGTHSDSVVVTVIEVPATGINITNSDDTIEIGDTYRINVKVEPANTTDTLSFRFTSSDESIATVDSTGKVTAKKSGKVTITVQSEDGTFQDTIELNVVVPSVVPNPNTGVKSVYVYLLSAIISLFGTIIVAKKRFN